MIGRSGRPVPARHRFDIARDLIERTGFWITSPTREPPGLVHYGSPFRAEWRLRGQPPLPHRHYIELDEMMDTQASYPEPWLSYEYLVHLDLAPAPGRNVSFHKDRDKPPGLLYHWHDYPDGARRSQPVPMSAVTLRWFLEAAWRLVADPRLAVPAILSALPPPGPGDPR